MRFKFSRIVSAILVVALCLSIAPLSALAEGGSGGGKQPSGGGSVGSYPVCYEGNPSGVRIYLATDQIVAQNLSSDKKTLTFGSKSNVAQLDKLKAYAIYEISEGSALTGKHGYDIVSHKTYTDKKTGKSYPTSSSKLYTWLPSKDSGNGMYCDAFVLPVNGDENKDGSISDTEKFNLKPNFKELVGSGHGSFSHWSPYEGTSNFSSLSSWANATFKVDSKSAVDINTFLKNYYSLLTTSTEKGGFGVSTDDLSWFPRTKSDFVNNNYCIVVEPVAITYDDNRDAVAWSAQDWFSTVGKSYKKEAIARGMDSGSKTTFNKIAGAMQKGYFINYTSNKYNQDSSPKGLVTAAPTGSMPNKAGGFAFYYSSDVVAQDVPVQVANTVVVDVGAPKYINGSATGGDLVSSGTLGVAVVNR